MKGIITQWTDIQPDGQQGQHASLNHNPVISEQVDKIESLERLVRALMSGKDAKAGTSVEKPVKGLVVKEIGSWSTGRANKDKWGSA